MTAMVSSLVLHNNLCYVFLIVKFVCNMAVKMLSINTVLTVSRTYRLPILITSALVVVVVVVVVVLVASSSSTSTACSFGGLTFLSARISSWTTRSSYRPWEGLRTSRSKKRCGSS